MSARKRFQVGLLIVLSISVLGAQSAERVVGDGDEAFEKIFPVEEYDSSWIVGDTNNDERSDYALKLNDRGQKRLEAVDFNFDGLMDDFYQYRNGVLHREELDTNFDGVVDLWIFMHDGVRVAGYERDTDFDGVVDIVKEFGDS